MASDDGCTYKSATLRLNQQAFCPGSPLWCSLPLTLRAECGPVIQLETGPLHFPAAIALQGCRRLRTATTSCDASPHFQVLSQRQVFQPAQHAFLGPTCSRCRPAGGHADTEDARRNATSRVMWGRVPAWAVSSCGCSPPPLHFQLDPKTLGSQCRLIQFVGRGFPRRDRRPARQNTALGQRPNKSARKCPASQFHTSRTNSSPLGHFGEPDIPTPDTLRIHSLPHHPRSTNKGWDKCKKQVSISAAKRLAFVSLCRAWFLPRSSKPRAAQRTSNFRMRNPPVAVGSLRVKKASGEHDTLGRGWSSRRLHGRTMGHLLPWVGPNLLRARIWPLLSETVLLAAGRLLSAVLSCPRKCRFLPCRPAPAPTIFARKELHNKYGRCKGNEDKTKASKENREKTEMLTTVLRTDSFSQLKLQRCEARL